MEMSLPRFLRLLLLPAAILLGAADNPDAVVAQRGDIRVTAGRITLYKAAR